MMLKFLERHRFFSFVLLILTATEIYFFSSISGKEISPVFPIKSMVYHFSVFFLFATFLLITIKGKNKISRRYLIISLFLSISYSFLDEIHQIFVLGRDASFFDFLTNNTGIMFSLILQSLKNIKKKFQQSHHFF